MEAPQNRFSREQKIGLILLSAFVLLAVTLGLIEMRNTLYRPFALNNSIPVMIGQQLNTPDALRYRDTDMDGLTDFDESYIYATSPYLADSDSDGISDKDEVAQGKNPNCAEGKDCTADIAGEGEAIGTASSTLAGQSELFNYSFPENFSDLLEQPDVLRAMLVDAGMDKSVVDKISDEDLIAIVSEIFASSTLMTGVSNATTTADITSTAKFINKVMGATQ